MYIRSCRESDLDALEWDAELAHDRPIIRSTFACTREGRTWMLVADEDREIVGQAWLDLRRTPGVGVIWALRVKPWHRGRRIGTRLVDTCERLMRSQGARIAEIEVQPHNVAARRLYERLGYEHVRSEPALDVFHKTVERASPARD
jgi:ribosomal protein S18 acetylase RimI-like enzyme